MPPDVQCMKRFYIFMWKINIAEDFLSKETHKKYLYVWIYIYIFMNQVFCSTTFEVKIFWLQNQIIKRIKQND